MMKYRIYEKKKQSYHKWKNALPLPRSPRQKKLIVKFILYSLLDHDC